MALTLPLTARAGAILWYLVHHYDPGHTLWPEVRSGA